jgi:HK97 family phage major capsid protein
MTTAAGFAPETLRNPALQVMSAQRTPVVQDLIPEIPTSQSAVVYMEETTFTNNAAPVAEGGSKPESANAWTERTVPVEVIATTLPVTDQQLEDVENIEATIRDRLTLMILLAEESQIVGGTGTSPELQGVLTKSGVQTYALNAEPVPDAIMRGITKVNVTGRARASGVVMHPNDYMDMRLLRTTDGIYIFGSPAEAGPATIWGLPIVSTDAMTENTSVVGDWRMFSRLVRRKGITIDVGFVNDDFKRNQRTIRAETRVAVVWIRPAAFCKVTGV